VFKNLFSKIKESYHNSRAWVLKKQIQRYEREEAEQEELLKQIEELRSRITEKRTFKEHEHAQAVAERERLLDARYIRKAFHQLEKRGIDGLSEVEKNKMANTLKSAANRLENNKYEDRQAKKEEDGKQPVAASAKNVNDRNKSLDEVTRFEFMKKIYYLEGENRRLKEANREVNERLEQADQQQREQNSSSAALAFALGETLVVMRDPERDGEKSFGGKMSGYLYDDNQEITHYLIVDPDGEIHAVSKELENDTLFKVPESLTLDTAINNIDRFLLERNEEMELPNQSISKEFVGEQYKDASEPVQQQNAIPDLNKIGLWEENDYLYAEKIKNEQGLVPTETILLFDNDNKKEFGVVLGAKEDDNHNIITAVQMIENRENGESNIIYLKREQMQNPNILIYEDQNEFIDKNTFSIDLEKLSEYQANNIFTKEMNTTGKTIQNGMKKRMNNEKTPVFEMER
jgi:hypothetical protein